MVPIVLLLGVAVTVAATPYYHTFRIQDVLQKQNNFESIETLTESTETGIAEEWFTQQKLDHFNPSNTRVWRQRYFANDQYYGGPGFPVFLYIEGESVASSDTVTSSGLFINTLARKYNALIVTLEHRYYGQSQPVSDFTVANLKYLSSDQALNDVASFQDHFIAKRNLINSKWITFGGSYPGMLAAWSRLKFPHRFVGAVSSSGPILAKANFHDYAAKTEFGLRYYGGDACANVVQQGLTAFHKLVASTKPSDVAQLNKVFKPCTPVVTNDDRVALESSVFWPFGGLSQGNDYAPYNLKAACNDFVRPGKTPVQKIADFLFRQNGGAACANSNYEAFYFDQYLTNTAIERESIWRQWSYQMCAEFGFGQNAASSSSIFSALSYVTVGKTHGDICKRVFNISDWERRPSLTNIKNGGLNINVGNVVFSTGNIDGWSALTITNRTGVINPLSEVVEIEGSSHCGDLAAPRPYDSPALTWGHQRIDAAVNRFLRSSR